ncbi:MAG: FAD-binding oxidoreductase [Planctomycetes bacterium]|nr:FAD-binding oxidoreductase [Planctomycetota bacterium]
MGHPARIVVVGGGIAGLSTAWQLARRGARGVVLVEAGPRLAAQATAQNAAILRTPMPDPVGEALGREGAAFLRAPPPDFAPGPLLDACGLLLVTERGSAGERDWSARLAARAAEVRELSAAELARRAPHVRGAGTTAYLLPREGRVDVPALAAGFERGARAGGVRIELRAPVRELLADARGVRLADGRVLAAERVVLCAGAWAGALARAAGSRVQLTPTRRHLFVTRASGAVDPRWPVVWRDDQPFYARPEAGGLLLSGCDEEPVDPDRLAAEPGQLTRTLALAGRFLELAEPWQIARLWAGIRTHAPDGRFAVGPDPDLPGLVWAGALGGHGITCAEVVGRVAAQWILDGNSEHPLAAELDPRRPAAASAGLALQR